MQRPSGSDGGDYFTGGSTYPTALGVYTGTSLGSLVPVATNSNFGTEPQIGGGADVPYSEVSFHTAAGTTYRASTDDFVRTIKGLGKIPVQRDTLYREVRVWS